MHALGGAFIRKRLLVEMSVSRIFRIGSLLSLFAISEELFLSYRVVEKPIPLGGAKIQRPFKTIRRLTFPVFKQKS